jgi:hypothetical protein
LNEELAPAVAAAIERYAGGEDVRWDTAFTAFPNPAQPGAMVGVVLVYIQIKGAVLGTHLTMTSLLSPNIAAEDVDKQVREIMSSIFEQRSEQLGSMSEQQEGAHANGQSPPVGGLILP